MAAEGADGLPLVAALLDLPGAHPDSATLRQIFSGSYSDSGVQAGMFSACRQGQQWALEHAPKMTVSLTVPSSSGQRPTPADGEAIQAWPAKLAFVSEALSHRDSQRQETCLKLACGWGTHAECLAAVPEALGGAGAGITALQLVSPGNCSYPRSQLVTPFLKPAAIAFTNLKSLTIDTCYAILPDPSLLPHLAHLCINQACGVYEPDEVHQGACASVGRFVPQLTSLYIDMSGSDALWDTIFAHTSDTLQVFGTRSELTDKLYPILTTKAPRLRNVRVGMLYMFECSTTKWPGWVEVSLELTDVHMLTTMLPVPTNPVTLRVSSFSINRTVPTDRLQAWLDQARWYILPRPYPTNSNMMICARDENQLRARLATLQAMKYEPTDVPKLKIELKITMTATAMQALEKLPHGVLLNLFWCKWPLEPAAYTQLAQHMPTSFATWQMSGAEPVELIQSVYAGVNERRSALSLPPIRLELHRAGDHVVWQ